MELHGAPPVQLTDSFQRLLPKNNHMHITYTTILTTQFQLQEARIGLSHGLSKTE